MSALESVGGMATGLSTWLDAGTASMRDVVAEMIIGPGGIGMIALGVLGVLVLCADAARVIVRVGQRVTGRSAGELRRTVRARALASAGTSLPDITRRTGLARDALVLVTVDAPAAAPTATVATPARPAAAQASAGPAVRVPRRGRAAAGAAV